MIIKESLFRVAQAIIPKGELTDVPNKDGSIDIMVLFEIAFAFGGVIALIVITIASFQFVISQGDSARVAKARNAIIYAAIGLAVCILAFTIVQFTVNEATA